MRNPFPGLLPFEPDQSDLFFGRDEQIAELIDRLRTRRFVGVVGTSGSGKSSLVRAGLIPQLQKGFMTNGRRKWRVVILRPGNDPLGILTTELAREFSLDARMIGTTLRESNRGLIKIAHSNLGGEESFLIIVDQFEELIRYRDLVGTVHERDLATSFVRLLLEATGHGVNLAVPDGPPLYVVITMRSEYLGKAPKFPGLPEALNDGQYLVSRMERHQLRQAIEGPLAMTGAMITPALVQELLNEASGRPDQLPLLQHALKRMWNVSAGERERGKPIDQDHYKAVGGSIDNALKLAADKVWQKLIEEDRRNARIVRIIFQRLTTPGAEDEEVRRPTSCSELAAVSEVDPRQIKHLVRAFSEDGFLTQSQHEDPIVDIAHESLIRQWRTLSDWVREESRSARLYNNLAQTAADKGALYSGATLSRALEWCRTTRPNAAWAERYPVERASFELAMRFLNKSRWYKYIKVSGIFLSILLIVILSLVLLNEKRRRLENEQQALRIEQKSLFMEKSLQEEKKREQEMTNQIESSNIAILQAQYAAQRAQVVSIPTEKNTECTAVDSERRTRVYVHIRDSKQRSEATIVAKALAAKCVLVPNVVKVGLGPLKTQLRYFRQKDYAQAVEVKDRIDKVLRSSVDLQLITGYDKSNPGHLELWFGPPAGTNTSKDKVLPAKALATSATVAPVTRLAAAITMTPSPVATATPLAFSPRSANDYANLYVWLNPEHSSDCVMAFHGIKTVEYQYDGETRESSNQPDCFKAKFAFKFNSLKSKLSKFFGTRRDCQAVAVIYLSSGRQRRVAFSVCDNR